MTPVIKLYEVPPSPNNMKVRIALGYKEIPYERIPIQSQPGVPAAKQDRSLLTKISRQPLTPVIVHGDVVMFDSSAILRYLEANFPESRPLFSTDYVFMKRIEEWEFFGRRELGEPIRMIFKEANAAQKDAAMLARARELFAERTERIETQLREGDWLCGANMSAADVVAATIVHFGVLTEEAGHRNPISRFFRENLTLGEDREKTREWARRVLSYDR